MGQREKKKKRKKARCIYLLPYTRIVLDGAEIDVKKTTMKQMKETRGLSFLPNTAEWKDQHIT